MTVLPLTVAVWSTGPGAWGVALVAVMGVSVDAASLPTVSWTALTSLPALGSL